MKNVGQYRNHWGRCLERTFFFYPLFFFLLFIFFFLHLPLPLPFLDWKRKRFKKKEDAYFFYYWLYSHFWKSKRGEGFLLKFFSLIKCLWTQYSIKFPSAGSGQFVWQTVILQALWTFPVLLLEIVLTEDVSNWTKDLLFARFEHHHWVISCLNNVLLSIAGYRNKSMQRNGWDKSFPFKCVCCQYIVSILHITFRLFLHCDPIVHIKVYNKKSSLTNKTTDSLWGKALELWGACLPEGWT